MRTKKTPPTTTTEIKANARKLLEFAEQLAREGASYLELSNALYSVEGKASQLFPSETERRAFSRTAECKRIDSLLASLPLPPVTGHIDSNAALQNQTISLRVSPAVHKTLLAEAEAAGVSLEQLCLSKLVPQRCKAAAQ